jgi:hypothetical protein
MRCKVKINYRFESSCLKIFKLYLI